MQALRSGGCTTPDIDKAQAVYVDLYCPYITWLGQLHHRGRDGVTTSPGDDILKVSKAFHLKISWVIMCCCWWRCFQTFKLRRGMLRYLQILQCCSTTSANAQWWPLRLRKHESMSCSC